MGKVIPFSEIESYLASIEKSDTHKGAILDTNILISASYDIRDSHSEVVDVWDLLPRKNYRLFATVKLHRNAKAKIQTLEGSLKTVPPLILLNALKASKLFFTVSLDFDIGYAALSDPNMKDIVVPDRLYKEYRHYHFPD